MVDGSTTAAAGLVFGSGLTGVVSAPDVQVNRQGSTANEVQQGPNITLIDVNATTITALQQSGGQTELWQYNGAWAQKIVITTDTISGYGPTAAALVDMTPDKGSFTGTFSGFASSPTGTCFWCRQGNIVTLLITGGQGVSNANSFSMTGLPSAIYPASTKIVAIPGGGISNSSATIDAGASRISMSIANSGLSGLINFILNGSANAWATSGTKGFTAPTEITYSLL